MSGDGVASTEFTEILSDFSRTLSYSVVTKTTNNMTGEETSSYGTASNVSAIFFMNDNKYLWDKEGLLLVGDAYIICPTSTGIKRYDKFTISGETYIVQDVKRRYVLGTSMHDFATCFKVV